MATTRTNAASELSLRKVPSTYFWGSVSGYANFTTGSGIFGRSGDPSSISPNGARFDPSGDFISYQNPRLKVGLYYQTPTRWTGLLGALAAGTSASLDYRANIPNTQLRQDFFLYEGQKYVRPWDQTFDLRLRRRVALPGGRGAVSPYLEVQNLFDQRWIFFQAVEGASPEAQQAFVESGFSTLPTADNAGNPVLDVGYYRNLPRTVVFGATFEF